MKKRLLSAALALAMVLTLLPVSAFALNNSLSGVATVSYYTAGQTINMAGTTKTITSTGWYETNTDTPVTNGVVAGSGTSGTWYGDVSAALYAKVAYIKLLGDNNSGTFNNVLTATTVDLNGHSFAFSGSGVNFQLTDGSSLTITDSSVTAGTSKLAACTAGITIPDGYHNKSAQVTLTDVALTGDITLDGTGTTGSSTYSNRQTVTLNGATVTGKVELKGNSSTLTLNPSSKRNNAIVSISGAVSLTGGTGLTLNAMNGSSSNRGSFSFASAVTITQENAGGTANFGSQTGSGTVAGKFTLTSPSGGTVTAYNTTFTGGAELTGYGTNFSATSCNIQAALAVGGVNAGSVLTDAQKSSLNAPTVNIVGGNVAELGAPKDWDEQLTKAYTVSISGNARVANAGFDNANVTVTSSEIGTGSSGVLLVNGTLTLAGDGGDAGNITLGGAGYGSAVLNVTGTNITTGKIDAASDNTRTVSVNIPASDTNYFAQLGDDTDGTLKNGSAVVKGGGFGKAVKVDYLDSSLQFQVNDKTSGAKPAFVYYGNTATDMNNLVAAYQKATTKSNFVVTPVYDGSGSDEASFKLVDGVDSKGDDNVVLEIKFKKDKAQTFTLPTWVNNRQVTVWTLKDNENVQRTGGATYMTSEDATFNAQEGSYSLTKLTNATVDPSSPNPGVTAVLSENTIKLSGNVVEKGTATIPLILTTDNGDKVRITVGWNGTATTFATNPDPAVLNVVDNGLALQVVNSSVKYTLDGSGLRRQVEKLNIGVGEIVTTVATSVPGTVLFREQLGKDMSSTGAGFDFSGSGSVSEAFGRAIAAITDANIVSWRTSAQNTAYRNEGGTGTPTDEQRQKTGYYDVYIVPYLNVNVTSIDNSGLMTATMEPYYRIEVRATGKDAIVVQTGRTMGVLSGEMGEVKVELPVQDAFQTGFGTAGYAHQNATYAYEVTGKKAASSSPASLSFSITHAANSGNGFGTIVINKVAPLITLKDKDDAVLGTYDALQAAVDDAENTDQIIVDAAYKGNRTINVTGVARTFKVDAKGPDGIKVSNTADTVSWQNDGGLYTVQLLRNNTVVKPTEGDVTITVATATNGRASVSASKAKAGDAITVTVTPNSGYNAGGLTIRTDKNTTVSYTSTGTNTYRFTVPEDVKTITVTPSFVAASTGATITVSNTSQGTATTSAGTNRVAVGSTVSVTTVPSTGYRTMGLYVTSNSGTATASRTGVNSFVFTVPAGATNVVVTPRFDVNNGTVFEDVWSTEYYSAPVAWAVGRGITDGTSTYTFSPGQTCNRVQMVTFLWRAAGRPSTTGMANPFYDVSASMGSDFYNAILWANAKGITQGDGSANRFNPYKTVTRAEAVTFLWRYENKPAAAVNSGFYDVPSSEWYAQAVTWAVGKGITNGDGSTVRFNPNGACLRAQIVTFLYRDVTGVRA